MTLLTLPIYVFRDTLTNVIALLFTRICIYPVVNINSKLQSQYHKVEDEELAKEKYKRYYSFPISAKLRMTHQIFRKDGFKGFFENGKVFIIPYLLTKICETIVYSTGIRTFRDVLKFGDALFLMTGIVCYFANHVAAFVFKFTTDIIKEKMNFKQILEHASLSNKVFWEQFEIELYYYHIFSFCYTYFMVIGVWYFEPGFYTEVALHSVGRTISAAIAYPVFVLSQWTRDYNFEYQKLYNTIVQKDGMLGLCGGIRDSLWIEVMFAVIFAFTFRFLKEWIP